MSSTSWKAEYDELVRRWRERALLASCSAVLGWDEQTYMPTGAAEARGEQLALLAGLQHDRATDPRVGDLLGALESAAADLAPLSPEAVNLREIRRSFNRQAKLPKALVEEIARVTSTAQQEWVAARKAADFGRFRPWLERIVDLKRQEAACVADGSSEAYNALLDEYEPGATADSLASLFGQLREALVPLVASIGDSTSKPKPGLLKGDFPVDRQKMLGEMVAGAIGFDFNRGRLDVSAHPFCTGIAPGDCRITTRYRPEEFEESFFGVMHEVGHALYEQGLDPAHYGTPMGEAVSLGVHESQSRTWENSVGRGASFWRYWLPIARRVFPGPLGSIDPEDFLRAINVVEPSLIRTQADEVTYNLHIMIRFDLERALLSGELAPADLPGAWDARYASDLGVSPASAADGCLQDIHWSAGLFGYFPTYTLGNLYGAQLFDKAREELGDLDSGFAAGDYSPLLAWLRDRIHRHGHRHRPSDLIEQATGSKPDPAPLIRELRSKYGSLYGIA
jgi:carboxypeptidase Taq